MEAVPVTSEVFVIMDLLDVAAFALSGGIAGRRKGLDFFGIMTVGAITGIGGGIIRDILIGAAPPAGLADWRYVAVALAAGAIPALPFLSLNHTQFRVLLVFDAVGLGLFTVVGTSKALDYDLPELSAIMIGIISATGGGVVRDLLTARVPIILRREVYALASAAGAIVVVLGDDLVGLYDPRPVWADWVAVLALLVTVGLRLLSLAFHWRSPAQQDATA